MNGPDLAAADLDNRRTTLRTLRDIRTRHDATCADIGAILGIGYDAVSHWERRPNPNPYISTLQRYARAVHHQAIPAVHDLPDPDPTAHTDLLHRLSHSTDLGRADTAHRMLALDHLARVRLHRGLSLQHVAAVMGVTASALCLLESSEGNPRLGTYQRYARALGGHLTITITPMADVDEVAVQRALAGQRTPRLTDAERVAVAAGVLHRGEGPTTVARILKCSARVAHDLLDRAAHEVAARQQADREAAA